MRQVSSVHYVHGWRHSRTPWWLISLWILVAIWVVSRAISFGVSQYIKITTPSTYAVSSVAVPSAKLERIAPLPAFNSTNIEETFAKWSEENQGHKVSIAIRSLDESSSYSSSNEAYFSASMYKLMMVPAFFEHYSLEDLDTVEINGESLRTCFESALLLSRNECIEHVAGNVIGWRNIANNLSQYDITSISKEGDFVVGAEDMASFLSLLYSGKLANDDETKYVLDLMSRQVWRNGIPAGCDNCNVMNKTGDNGVRHDAAIIERGGKKLALVILSDGISYNQIADLTTKLISATDLSLSHEVKY